MQDEVVIIGDIVITPLLRAKKVLNEALQAPKNDLSRDASIQRFEFTFELAWKTLKRVLRVKGISANSPRDVFRDAARVGLIQDPSKWYVFLENRNRTAHVYNEGIAEEIYSGLPEFAIELSKLIDVLCAL